MAQAKTNVHKALRAFSHVSLGFFPFSRVAKRCLTFLRVVTRLKVFPAASWALSFSEVTGKRASSEGREEGPRT